MQYERSIKMTGREIVPTLDGRKTQVLQIINPQPELDSKGRRIWRDAELSEDKCPFGVPGDRLWVREIWRIDSWDDAKAAVSIHYQADNFCDSSSISIPRSEYEKYQSQCLEDAKFLFRTQPSFGWVPGKSPCRWRTPSHMPRWASRIFLEVTKVQIKRVQEISDADAKAEGIIPGEYRLLPWVNSDNIPCAHCGDLKKNHAGNSLVCVGESGTIWDGNTSLGGFATFWESHFGFGSMSWDYNPYVWVIDYKKVELNSGGYDL